MKKKHKIIGLSAAILVFMVLIAAVYLGIIQINHPSKTKYPIRGADVSSYQGEIDWQLLSQQEIEFAYIKVTEGSSFTDEHFNYNWEQSEKTDLRIGAYHFFSFESSGRGQAKHFCSVVSLKENMLPPVVDVEPYGLFDDKHIQKGVIPYVTEDLTDWLVLVEAEYGIRPIIYTTEAYYNDFIKDAFPEYNIWIRDVYHTPSKNVDWVFWQYSNRMRLNGYSGDEKYIDMNVFCGTADEFSEYGKLIIE